MFQHQQQLENTLRKKYHFHYQQTLSSRIVKTIWAEIKDICKEIKTQNGYRYYAYHTMYFIKVSVWNESLDIIQFLQKFLTVFGCFVSIWENLSWFKICMQEQRPETVEDILTKGIKQKDVLSVYWDVYKTIAIETMVLRHK